MALSPVKLRAEYLTIQDITKSHNIAVQKVCETLGINRSSYYKWLKRKKSIREIENEKIIHLIKSAYEERNGILGYRQMTRRLCRRHGLKINQKRVYRLMKSIGIQSVCRKKRKKFIKSTPEIIAENILNREFKAEKIHEKWLTDITEFKCANGKKAYLSAVLDLGDKSIVSYAIGHSNNNALVFETFDNAIEQHPNAQPLFHSDRGFQYTSKIFRKKLDNAGMAQSMSRVGRCIDNGPMECFWGILKSEMYYITKFHDFKSLKDAIEEYIQYYNCERYQGGLNDMTPHEYRRHLLDFAA